MTQSNPSDLPAGDPTGAHHGSGRHVVGGPGYEVRDTNVAAIVTFVVSMFVILVVTQAGLWGLLRVITGTPAPEAPPTSPYAESPRAGMAPDASSRMTPEVVLEINEQRRELKAREDATLGEYGRDVDNTKGGPVRIPIDRAIDLIAERGMPAAGKARTEVEVNSHAGTPAPVGPDKDKKDEPAATKNKDRGEPEKGTKK